MGIQEVPEEDRQVWFPEELLWAIGKVLWEDKRAKSWYIKLVEVLHSTLATGYKNRAGPRNRDAGRWVGSKFHVGLNLSGTKDQRLAFDETALGWRIEA